MKRTTFLSRHPKIRHWIHFLCGAAAAYCMPNDYQSGWAIILGFHSYEAWEDFGYLHDCGFKDIWEFWVTFIPLAVILNILKGGFGG